MVVPCVGLLLRNVNFTWYEQVRKYTIQKHGRDLRQSSPAETGDRDAISVIRIKPCELWDHH